MERIFRLLIVVVAVVGGIFWYVHWSQTRALNSGDVYVRDQSGDNTQPATPEPITPQPAAPEPTASAPAPTPKPHPGAAQAAAPQLTATPKPQPTPPQSAAAPKPQLQPTAPKPAGTPKPQRVATPKLQPTPPQEIASNSPPEQPHTAPSHTAPSHIGPAQRPAAIPASDTIRRNPPNGQLFAGSGRFQLYRQGDITWRLDTQTGHACILFASDAQWSNTRVFDRGCGAS